MAALTKQSQFSSQFGGQAVTSQAVETKPGEWKQARKQWKDHLDGTNGAIHHASSLTQKITGGLVGIELTNPAGWVALAVESPGLVTAYVAATIGKAFTQTKAEAEAMRAAGVDEETIKKKQGIGRTAHNLLSSLNPFSS